MSYFLAVNNDNIIKIENSRKSIFYYLKRKLLIISLFSLTLIAGCNTEKNEEKTIKADQLSSVIPKLNIETKINNSTGEHEKIERKDSYLQARLNIDGQKKFDNLDNIKIKIKKRGNTTFNQPKAPYKIKLDKEALSILGLPAGKSWILLANYNDGPLMSNVLAMKLGRLLKMPYTNTIVPVELNLNGDYLGVYLLTTHKEVGENRIDIGKDGFLLELTRSRRKSENILSKNHYLFTSERYMLPVYIRHPSLNKLAKKDSKEASFLNTEIKNDFNKLEKLIASNDFPKDYGKLIDKNSIAKLLIVHQLTRNREINHPKSIYLYKSKNQPYSFGPIWDFDWAYGGSSEQEFFVHAPKSGLFGGNQPGAIFFQRFLSDPEIKNIFEQEWINFKKENLEDLINYMDEYASLLKNTGAYSRDYQRWYKQQDKSKNSLLMNNERFLTYIIDSNILFYDRVWTVTRLHARNRTHGIIAG